MWHFHSILGTVGTHGYSRKTPVKWVDSPVLAKLLVDSSHKQHVASTSEPCPLQIDIQIIGINNTKDQSHLLPCDNIN